MNVELHTRFKGKGASQSLAVAALLRCVLENRSPTFGEMAVVYREDHLELHREDRGDIGQVGGALSVDEVRRHLERSVLPRLATAGVLEPLPDTLDTETVIRLSSELHEIVHADVQTARDVLMDIAQEAVHSSDATGHVPPGEDGWGSTLSARGITKIYKRRRVVDQVDVEVRQGEIVGLLGPNGAGKTTSFYMIVGLIRPDEGDIFIDGQSISGLPMYKRARRGIGYLAQEPSVFRKLSVEGNVMAILETLKLNDDERRERLDSLLDELSIKHLRHVAAYNLSGGERRRLEITRALVTEPKFMLLDEPFAGVDPIAVHDIQTIVAGLRRRGIGVLITDHNVEQTLDIVDRAYIMFEGQVQVSGSVRDLVLDDRVADLYLGPTLTARLRERLGASV
jgi:lipopolysaccharide export system ATP-binding protein